MMLLVHFVYGFLSFLLIILIMVFFKAYGTEVEGENNLVLGFFQGVDDRLGGLLFIFIGIGLTTWMTPTRLVRSMILSMKEREFILATQSLGASNFRVIIHHLLPNVMGPLIVVTVLSIPTFIMYEAFLSFLGLGVTPPTPSWGGMISEGVGAMRAHPHLIIFPALTLSLAMLGFNLLGDGLRNSLDPKAIRSQPLP